MPLSRDFPELVQRRVASDPDLAEALLREGIHAMLAGDIGTRKTVLRDYIKGDGWFREIGRGDRNPAQERNPHV